MPHVNWIALPLAALLLAPCYANADDGAASIAAGGLVAKRETRVVMAKEVLRLGGSKIIVDYDFRNDSAQDVVTEVAFPVPPYSNDYPEGPFLEEASFQDFKLWVNEKPVQFQVQATATFKGKDVTAELSANHIDIATLGHFTATTDSKGTEHPVTHDLIKLPRDVRRQLIREGLFEDFGESAVARWKANLQYHWTQVFPAHGTVHIRHEYTPVRGSKLIVLTAVRLLLAGGKPVPQSGDTPPDAEGAKLLSGFCPDTGLLRTIVSREEAQLANDPDNNGNDSSAVISPRWIDFILTTANTWQRPIEDFTLIIERPKPSDKSEQEFVSFCSPGKVEKIDADHFQVHLTGFIPKYELHIGFLALPAKNPSN